MRPSSAAFPLLLGALKNPRGTGSGRQLVRCFGMQQCVFSTRRICQSAVFPDMSRWLHWQGAQPRCCFDATGPSLCGSICVLLGGIHAPFGNQGEARLSDGGELRCIPHVAISQLLGALRPIHRGPPADSASGVEFAKIVLGATK